MASSDMSRLALTVTSFLSAILLLAATAKTRSVRSFANTLADLGLPTSLTSVLARAVIVGELLVAVALVIAPGDVVDRAGVAALGLGFFVAGLRSLSLGGHIECRCFGSVDRSQLGWRQVGLLPAWVLSVLIAPNSGQYSFLVRLEGLLVSLVIFAVIFGIIATDKARRARQDRIAVDAGLVTIEPIFIYDEVISRTTQVNPALLRRRGLR